MAHKAAASAVACQLHVVYCMAGVRGASWRYLLDATHFRKKHARCVGGKELGVGELHVHCADRQDCERKRSETLPVACNIIV